MCAVRSCQIQLSEMSLRGCDMFLIMIMFCSAVRAIRGMCTTSEHARTHTSMHTHMLKSLSYFKLLNPWFPLCSEADDKFSPYLLTEPCWEIWTAPCEIIKIRLHEDEDGSMQLLGRFLQLEGPWCLHMLMKFHSKLLPLRLWKSIVLYLHSICCICKIYITVNKGILTRWIISLSQTRTIIFMYSWFETYYFVLFCCFLSLSFFFLFFNKLGHV